MPDAMVFVVSCLAVWRLTHLVVAEDGPAGVVASVREWLGSSALGLLMDCFLCLSIWIAAPFAVWCARDVASGLVIWLGLSGAACVIERVTAARGESDERERKDGLLR